MKPITVFEHKKLVVNELVDDKNNFTLVHLTALQKFYTKNDTFFKLIHNGVEFKQFVGVFQVGNLTIEILPKLDNNDDNDEKTWRDRLISMLKYVGYLKVHTPTQSSLSVHHSSILELYIELFCREVETLMHKGLIKKYRIEESNQKALKGALVFSKHISKNLVHKELFFVRSSTYDVNHPIHQILYAALLVLKRLQISPSLHTLIAKITMFFPEQKKITVTQKTFDTLRFNRKTETYRPALMIARLILLQFHPDVKEGKNDILALLFDMNRLWEAYVGTFLKRNLGEGYEVSTKYNSRDFTTHRKVIKPDIIISKSDKKIILDAKWKQQKEKDKVASSDMYQIYAYGKFFNADNVALIYPGKAPTESFDFLNEKNESDINEKICCSIIRDDHFVENEKFINLTSWVKENLPKSPSP